MLERKTERDRGKLDSGSIVAVDLGPRVANVWHLFRRRHRGVNVGWLRDAREDDDDDASTGSLTGKS